MIGQFEDENYLHARSDGVYLRVIGNEWQQTLVAPWPPGFAGLEPSAMFATTQEKNGDPDEIVCEFKDLGAILELELVSGDVYGSLPRTAADWNIVYPGF